MRLYWGLRDYGTATWHGGDSACLHSRQTSSHEATVTSESRPANVNHAREPWKGGRCGRCGAMSEDAQLGTESLHDCLAWARQAPPCGQCYVCGMRQVASELWRVLRSDGVWFLNLGDSYSSGGRGTSVHHQEKMGRATAQAPALGHKAPPPGLKPKDLVGIPWRVALALQADGWVLRSDIIWEKPNAMPESVTDRPTRSHEYVFLLAKQTRYFWDHEAVKESAVATSNRGGCHKTQALVAAPGALNDGFGERWEPSGIRNVRTVWTIPTESYAGAHYATFPQALVERCLKAGTSAAGCCAACGSPWVREVERSGLQGEALIQTTYRPAAEIKSLSSSSLLRTNGRTYRTTQTLGFSPSCLCNATARPCIVLDPFAGSGTVGLLARALGRHAILCDLSYTYLHDQARPRLQLDALAAWEGTPVRTTLALDVDDLPLFCYQEVQP